MAKGCCKDEVKICKTDNYKTARHFVAINPVHQDLAPLVLPLLITYTDLQTQTSVITYNRFKRSPEPIYLLFQVFRI